MSVLKFARTAAAVAAASFLPAHAIAQTSTLAPVVSESVARAGASLDEESRQLESLGGYVVPVLLVIALGLGLYFILDEDDTVSP